MNTHKQSRLYDLAIVGAGFAGLVCARTAALRGLRVCVIEAKKEPGARIHTTGILVKEAADEIDLPHHLARRVHGVRLYAPNRRTMDLFAPGYYFLTTHTAELLRWLAQEARRAGAEIFCGERFQGAERCGDTIRIADPDIETRYLIGADGARSRVARSFGLGRVERYLTGVEAEYENLAGLDPRFLHCFVDSLLAPGYLAWAAPGPEHAQIGLATSKARTPDLAAFTRSTGDLFGYDGARLVERRSGRIPCGGLVDPIGTRGVALVGDAAGLVSPLTGGGIRLAFRSGRRAAQAVSDYLLDSGPPPECVLAAEYPGFGMKKLMRTALDTTPSNRLVDLAFSLPGAEYFARWVYFHRRGGPGLSWSEFVKRLEAGEAVTR